MQIYTQLQGNHLKEILEWCREVLAAALSVVNANTARLWPSVAEDAPTLSSHLLRSAASDNEGRVFNPSFSTFIMSSAQAMRKSGGKRHNQLWHQLVVGMSQSPTTQKWVFVTTRSVQLALKDLLSEAGRFARETHHRSFRSLSTPTMMWALDWVHG